MKKNIILYLLICAFLSCKKEKGHSSEKVKETNTVSNKTVLKSSGNNRTDWKTFILNENVEVASQDTFKIVDFKLKFKYPPNLIAEAIENGRCIGKKRTLDGPDDPVTNTMDCCIWLTDLKAEPTDYYLKGERRRIKTSFKEVKDTVIIAKRKSLRVQFIEDQTKKVLVDYAFIDLDEYQTSFQINNKMLSQKDFEFFLKSIEVIKE